MANKYCLKLQSLRNLFFSNSDSEIVRDLDSGIYTETIFDCHKALNDKAEQYTLHSNPSIYVASVYVVSIYVMNFFVPSNFNLHHQSIYVAIFWSQLRRQSRDCRKCK